MKDKLIQIRVDESWLFKLRCLQSINGFKTTSEAIREVIEKEWRKEYCTNICEECWFMYKCEKSTQKP